MKMKAVAKFEKVSMEQFKRDMVKCFPSIYCVEDEVPTSLYENLKLPRRATKGSAGYDFFSPIPFCLLPGQTITFPTGIRCKIDDGYVLKIYPRSGLGFKYRLQLNNTVGIIDSDYYNAKNEGHIMAKLTNDTNEGLPVNIKLGDALMQGVFVEYFIAYDDNATEERVGGLGSTSK